MFIKEIRRIIIQKLSPHPSAKSFFSNSVLEVRNLKKGNFISFDVSADVSYIPFVTFSMKNKNKTFPSRKFLMDFQVSIS